MFIPETAEQTGCREDLSLDRSRCLRVRFSGSSCSRCVNICPHGAIDLSGGLSIDSGRCRGCLLCTAVCPVGALEQCADFSVSLSSLARVSDPTVGCARSQAAVNLRVPCLGGLAIEHLLALLQSPARSITLARDACDNCPNRSMIPHLQARLDMLAHVGLSLVTERIRLAATTSEISCQEESVSRRSFFSSLRRGLLKSAQEVIAPTTAETERHSRYGEKRVPARQQLLTVIRSAADSTLITRIDALSAATISFGPTCSCCQGCVAICPTGALVTAEMDRVPAADPQQCTVCGLCVEFCIDRGVKVVAAG